MSQGDYEIDLIDRTEDERFVYVKTTYKEDCIAGGIIIVLIAIILIKLII